MQRTIGRAYQRLRGTHPRRPRSGISHLLELACDALLAASALALLSGLDVAIWGLFGGFTMERLVLGFVLVGCGLVLLFTWERLAWAPLARQLDELS